MRIVLSPVHQTAEPIDVMNVFVGCLVLYFPTRSDHAGHATPSRAFHRRKLFSIMYVLTQLITAFKSKRHDAIAMRCPMQFNPSFLAHAKTK
jgi:hypothetical protein